MFKGVLVPLDESHVVHIPAGGIMLQCIGLCSAMVLVGVATSFLVGKMGSHYEHALQSQKVLSQLTHEQNALFEGMTEGIVTTDSNFSIVSVNTAATLLLELDPKDCLGSKIATALISSCYQADIEQEVLQDRRSGEFSLQRNAEESEICVSFQSRSISGEDGSISGWMFIFYDVTHLRSIEEQLNVQERMARLLASDSSAHIGSSSFLKEFVGESALMKKVFGLIERVAPSDATVLISGASGTGKELVARSIHLGGPRSSKPFVPVNCGAIPEGLIESELFGHKKGAFTGADSDHTGLFRRAEGGTIFLDEIGELPLLMQAKLLRALQEKRVRPVGSDSSLPIDVRIIAATNRNLREESKEGKFREDLYYRLNVINICLPALKDRREDIPLLVNSILKRIVAKDITPVVAPAVLQKLMSYDYPGNVRELENILERAVVFGGEAILPEHLPDLFAVDGAEAADAATEKRPDTAIIELDYVQFPVNLDEFLKDLEKRYIETALTKSGGVKKRAAEMLGMNFRSFRYRLQKFDIDRE
jgi:two-component system response regulator PilR (NtrC family)